ncbi:MAG TPA: OmpA family protein [Bryobacteraceae bacterium]|nr:OmpA family protein [Bryobacteraceae bacterium]
MKRIVLAVNLCFACFALCAQVPNPMQQQQPPPQADVSNGAQPVFRVTVVARTIKAINFHHRQGSTEVDLHGTALMPRAKGTARVDSRVGSTKIDTSVEKLSAPETFGPEYLTYVLWAVTPEGRAMNLGELQPNGDHAKLLSTSDLQAFALIVTAEPYFAVTQPSDVVVMENFVREDTTGIIENLDAKYELLQRGYYTMNVNAVAIQQLRRKYTVPLQLQEAENAVKISEAQGAQQYANDTLQKALLDLRNAEDYYRGKSSTRPLETVAREATQMAEDARIIAIKREQQEALDKERADAAAREAAAKAQADEESRRRAIAEQEKAAANAESARLAQARRDAEQEKLAADQARQAAEAATAEARRQQAAADAARAAAVQQQQQLQTEADRAKQAATQAEAEKEEMRQRLLNQLNLILETRDTARGLIVNMSDVLFDFGKATLHPGTREKLAKLSGIVLAYPGLHLQVEGHTDSVGSDEYNMTLSQKRSDAVRDYLVSQGISADAVTSQGFGKADPVASNDTAAGRQQNRRVEIVVAGEVIGTTLGSTHSNSVPQR